MPRSITVTIVPKADPPAPEHRLEVTINGDRTVTIVADSYTAALLAGRSIFGSVEDAQAELESGIADAWYAAECPR